MKDIVKRSIFVLFLFINKYVSSERVSISTINEQWVCDVKKNCLDCLRLAHCTWCKSEQRCFSRKLPIYEQYCANNTTSGYEHIQSGLSLEESAQCACASGIQENRCLPPDARDAEECTGRGKCICGRCVCNTPYDAQYPTKVVMGEFCEYDNFSCDGPKCTEGPYHLAWDEDKGYDELGRSADTPIIET